jgi:hypothetical protein
MTLSPNSVSDPHHGYADLYHGTALPSTVVKRACPTVPNHCHPGFGTPPSPTVNPGSPIANSRLGLAPPLRWLYGGLVRVPGVKIPPDNAVKAMPATAPPQRRDPAPAMRPLGKRAGPWDSPQKAHASALQTGRGTVTALANEAANHHLAEIEAG